jgi:hypothetical protein
MKIRAGHPCCCQSENYNGVLQQNRNPAATLLQAQPDETVELRAGRSMNF